VQDTAETRGRQRPIHGDKKKATCYGALTAHELPDSLRRCLHLQAVSRQSLRRCAGSGRTGGTADAAHRPGGEPAGTAFVAASGKADFRVRYFTPHAANTLCRSPDDRRRSTCWPGRDRIKAGSPSVVRFEFDIGPLPVEVYFSPGGEPQRVVMSQPAPEFGEEIGMEEVGLCFDLGPADIPAGLPAQVNQYGGALPDRTGAGSGGTEKGGDGSSPVAGAVEAMRSRGGLPVLYRGDSAGKRTPTPASSIPTEPWKILSPGPPPGAWEPT